MAVRSGNYDPNLGPLLNAKIAFPGNNGIEFPLLLDTGADGTSISWEVINLLGLRHHGYRPTVTSTGQPDRLKTFLVDFSFELDDGTFWRYPGNLEVAEFRCTNTRIRGIIGRDVICLGNFTLRSDQSYTIEM